MMIDQPAPIAPEPAPKRKPPVSHIPRALAELKRRGYRAKPVEKWNSFAKIRQDLWGFDIEALRPGEILFVQVTGGDGGNHAARRTKLLASAECRDVLLAGGRAAVWSYALRGEAGDRKLYELREQDIYLHDMQVIAAPAPVSPRKAAARERALAKRAQTRLRLSPPPTLH